MSVIVILFKEFVQQKVSFSQGENTKNTVSTVAIMPKSSYILQCWCSALLQCTSGSIRGGRVLLFSLFRIISVVQGPPGRLSVVKNKLGSCFISNTPCIWRMVFNNI